MYQFFTGALTLIATSIMLFSCTPAKNLHQTEANIKSLKYLGAYHIPYNLMYSNSTVGGLSGIDYDVKKDLYYLVSDDRGEKDPARFYTAKIFITANGIDSVLFTSVHYLQQPNGAFYPGIAGDRHKTPDPEAIRVNPKNKYLVWSSEGERIVQTNDTVLIDPAVCIIKPGGKYIDSFAIPGILKMKSTENGPRRNGVFEGMSFADNYQTLFVNTEEPLYDDGPRADMTNNNAFIRLIKFDVETKKSTAQYAYPLEPVAFKSKPENAFKLNGVSEILYIGNNKLLVTERSYSTGRLPSTIRVFIADLNGATDISVLTLKNNQSFTPAKKTLLLNMDDLGIYTDNLEGVTFGPLSPNGHKTLLFIADNNFNMIQRSQVLLFEVLE
jgi:hypothetical protein